MLRFPKEENTAVEALKLKDVIADTILTSYHFIYSSSMKEKIVDKKE
ncbi:MAG: hypothetical protein GX238_04370 [Epulopiscium sp.]|nr:hypothetical protein [Candidatus Epulonipiscium sp.]